MKKLILFVLLALLMFPCLAYGGATGKISGRVLDVTTGTPLPFVNVFLPDIRAGAVSDKNGYFHILNVPPGTYVLVARMIGYADFEATEVRVIVDQTTTVNVSLRQEAIELKEVKVVGERIIPKDVTATKEVITGEQLMVLPVQTPEQALLTETSVVTDPNLGEIHIRGGRGGEVLYLVDGMSIKDPLVGGGFGMRMGRNAVEEMAIITGGWSAEYGNAQSGIINMLTREGSEKMTGRVLYKTDKLGVPALNELPVSQPTNTDITEMNVGGPEPITQYLLPALGVRLPGTISYFMSGTSEWTDTYYPYNVRRSIYEIAGVQIGDRQQNYYTANSKLTWNLAEQKNQKKVTFGFRGSWVKRDGFSWKWRYVPENCYKVREESYQASLAWNHTLTGNTFYTMNLSKFVTGREVLPGGKMPNEIVHYTGTRHGTSDDTLDVNMGYSGGLDGRDEPFVDRPIYNGLYDFGEPFVDLGGRSGFWDPGEPFTDIAAKNGHYDLGEPFRDWNGNGQWDGDEPFWDWGPDGLPNTNDDGEGDMVYQVGEPFLDYNKNDLRDEKTGDGFVDWGYDQWTQWHKRRTDVYTLKADLTTQRGENHLLKAGFEVNYHEINHQEVQYGWWQDVERDPVPGPWPNIGIFRDFYYRTPLTGAFYVQDKIETEGMVINAGVRVDFFGPGGQVDELREPREIKIFGIKLTDTRIEAKLSPRLGIAYPITEKDLLYFSYGHFSQVPELQYFYQDTTQFGSAIRLYGNPNLEAEKTIAYELGVKHAFTDRLAIDFTGFFKDVRGLVDTEKRGVPPLTYQLRVNKDYGNTRGLEISIDKRYSNYIAGTASYTLAWAMGKSSSDRQGYDYDYQGRPLPLREYPLDWDQRHAVTVNADIRAFEGERPSPFGIRLPDRWGLNILWQYGSGLPFTGSDSLASETPNDRRKPWTSTVDMKANKDFNVGPLAYSIVLEVRNLFDRTNVRRVWTDTGTAHGDGRDIERDPTYVGPRRNVRLGLGISW